MPESNEVYPAAPRRPPQFPSLEGPGGFPQRTNALRMRRFTWLTNAHSKKIQNHEAAIALHYMHYNFCRIHQSLQVTPAMDAAVADHVWSLEEITGLL